MGFLSDLFSDHNEILKIPNIPAIMPLGAVKMIETGNLPKIEVINILLKKGEQCGFVERAIFLDEKIIKHRDGSFGGFSFRICKGVTYRTGKFGSSPKDKVIRQQYKGILYITNKRIIFVGNQNSFEKKINDLTAVVADVSKAQLHFGNKIITLFLPDGNLVSKVINLFNAI